tara:strand:+ start:367 stop:687 length:321 start_codon:yes stop_codon:yes gene_type:complete
MAIRQNKLEIINQFVEKTYDEIKAKYSEEAGIKNVLHFLIEKGLVDPKKLRDYMVMSDFAAMLKKNKGKVVYAFMDLSVKYDITERTAANIVYKRSKSFKKEYNIR